MAKPVVSDRRFFIKVLLPVVISGLLALFTLAAFMIWSTGKADQHATDRQVRLAERALADQVSAVPSAMLDLAAWDESLNAIAQGDIAWLDQNLGTSAYQYYGLDRTFVLDGDLNPVYAMRDGGQVAPEAFAVLRDTAAPLLARLRGIDGQAGIAAFNSGVADAPPAASDIVMVEGQAAVVTAMPVVSDSGDIALPPGREPVILSVVLLGADLAATLAEQYLFADAGFVLAPPAGSEWASTPVRDAAGRPVAWFAWHPDRPGAGIVSDTLPAMAGTLLVAGIIVALLLRNLGRATTQLEAERAEAQHRALHDPLTGLGNRALFRDRLGAAVAAMPRGEPRLALHALDLDRFKQVNDTLGHDAGDELLRQVSGRIGNLLREGETLVRLGGDEFAVIQPGIGQHEEATGLAERIIETLRAPFHIAGNPVQIGVSIGICTAPDQARTEAELATRADDALYRAKHGGRNRHCLHGAPAGEGIDQLNQALHAAFPSSGAAA